MLGFDDPDNPLLDVLCGYGEVRGVCFLPRPGKVDGVSVGLLIGINWFSLGYMNNKLLFMRKMYRG